MRMKMFAAATFEDAKAMIFAEMGEDAVILSEREVNGGVEVRAATDKMGGGMVPNEPLFMSRFADAPVPRHAENPLRSRVRDALIWHGAPASFARRISEAGVQKTRVNDPVAAIEAGLSELIDCRPIPAVPDRDIILVGAPGHGRTATAAKLTRRASIARAQIMPVAADLDATAGGEQLAAYLERESHQVRKASTPDLLFEMMRKLRADGHRCVIDMPAIIPGDTREMAQLTDLVAALDAEPVLVMSAEGHPDDQADAARAFARAGVARAILTKLDVARRRGGAIAALSNAGIGFSHLAATPFIGGGLVPAGASRMAGLLLEESSGQIALKGAA